MITKDVLLPPRQDLLLSLTDPNISHPLHQTTNESSNSLSTQKGCKIYFWYLRHPKHKPIIIPTLENGQNITLRKEYQIHI